MQRLAQLLLAAVPILTVLPVAHARMYDVVITAGQVYDGSGGPPYVADIGIKDGCITSIGQLEPAGAQVVAARGLAVAPGFINMLSWATDNLLVDGRSQSDIRQGVTLEVMGEGWSMGPLNDAMKREMRESQGDLKFPVEWTTLGEYLDCLVRKGVSTNVASFVGATTVRVHTVGYDDRPATAGELRRMQELVGAAMQEGAVGVSSALIYAPGSYARADELTALAEVAGRHGGLYISHIRSEGNGLLEALDGFIATARKANVAAELYHMKAAGQANWGKCAAMIEKIEAARAQGLRITADMYTYTAGATGLDASMPPWVQSGGHRAWVRRLQDPAIRRRVIKEMTTPSDAWENFYLLAGDPKNILFVGFKNEKLKPLTGKTLAEIAAMRGTSPPETIIDLVIEDDSRVGTIYFLMSEENVKRQIALPWVSFCSDAGSLAPEGVFLKSSTHPRAYGSFARLLGKYVREEKVIPLEEAVRRLAALPAENLRLDRRGRLKTGYHADIVVFDPQTITDRATYENPHQYATGMVHVFVNGTQVLKDGEHTGAAPGQVVRGPGWKGPATAQYTADPAWPRKPEHFKWGHMPGVAVDSYDRVYLFNRAEPAVQVYRADGVLVRTWSIDDVGGAHGIRIGPGNTVWTTDITNHVVRKYSPEGQLLLTLGEFGRAGNDEKHFDRPTDLVVLPNGEIYVTDGYGNRRVVHFDANGRYVAQWGQAGTEPGQFALPHAIVADSRDRLYVADRENARIQVFDKNGKLLDVWANVVTPWGLHMTRNDELWVCGSSAVAGPKPGEWMVLPPPDQVVMKLSLEGKALLRVPLRRGMSAPRQAGEVDWVHGIALDSKGNLYLGDIQGQRLQKFMPTLILGN